MTRRGGRRKQQGVLTRLALLDALEALLERHTWHSLSVSALAKEVGLVSTAVYQYWPNLDAALVDLIRARRDARAPLSDRLTTLAMLVQDEAAIRATDV